MIEVREYKGNKQALLKLVFSGVLFSILFAWLLFGSPATSIETQISKYWMAWFGLVFFSLCTVVLAFKLLRSSNVVLKLTSDSIWLGTLGGGITVPWAKVVRVSETRFRNQRFMVLELSEEFFKSAHFPMAILDLQRSLGIQGLPIPANTISVRYEILKYEIERFWQASRQ